MPHLSDRRDVMRLAAALAALPFGAAQARQLQAPERTQAMAGDAAHDFDFLHGSWRVRHRRRRKWLENNDEWFEFDGTCICQPLLGGAGNVEDNFIDMPAGAYRAVGLRALDPASGKWSIWWLDGRFPHKMDVPVVGRFENGVGTFFADDTVLGRQVRVRFTWSEITAVSAHWSQAFSPDGGATWETNWRMRFTRS